MNIHSTDYIGSLGLYPIEEIITNTSNNLINYTNNSSNLLTTQINTTSNNLADHINTTSNNLADHINTEILRIDNDKEDKFTPLTPLLVLASDASGNVSTTTTTSTELGTFSGTLATHGTAITALETQINITPHPLVAGIPVLDVMPFYQLVGTTAITSTTNAGAIALLVLGKLDKTIISHISAPFISPMYIDNFGYLQIELSDDLDYFPETGEVGLSSTFKDSKLDSSIVENVLLRLPPYKSPLYIDLVGYLQIATNNDLDYDPLTGEVGLSTTFKDSKENTINLGATQFALINNTSGKVDKSTITKVELETLTGIGTTSIATQFIYSSNYTDRTSNLIMTDINGRILINTSNYTDRMSNIIMTDVNQKFIYSSNYTDRTSNLIMTDVNTKFIHSSNYTDRTSNLIMTDVNQKFIHSSNYTDRTSNLIMTDVNQKFIYSSNYTDRTSNLIMTDVNTKFIHSSNYTDRTSNLIMTDVNQKFVHSSNYTDRTSNLIMTDVNQKFVHSSNYTNRTSNLIMTDVNTKLNNKANNGGYTTNSVVITDGSGNITTTATLPVIEGGTGKTSMTANRLLGCLGTANQYNEIELGSTLTFSGNTLNATGGGTPSQWTTVNTNDIHYSLGNVGINTNASISSKLTINPIVVDRNNFNHSEAPLTITNPTGTGTAILNDPKSVLHLCRQGTNAQAFGAKASLKLCRWENNAVNSRSRLDITLSHASYDDVNVMSMRSDGNVGIGTTNPITKLDVGGIIKGVGVSISGINDTLSTIEQNIINGTVGNISSVFGGDNYISSYWGLSIYLNQGGSGDNAGDATRTKIAGTSSFTINTRSSTSTTSYDKTLFVVRNSGNVGIGTTNPETNLHVQGKCCVDTLGVGLPANGTYGGNNGTRLVLWKGDANSCPYALGITNNTLWYGVPGGQAHRWYKGTTNVMSYETNDRFWIYFPSAQGGWQNFDITPTSLWGDGLTTASDQAGTKYTTMRNMMFQNPHIVPQNVGGNAIIRYGRAGGIQSGNYWDGGVLTNGNFYIASNNSTTNGIQVNSSGNLTVAGTASFKFPNDSWMVSAEGMQRFFFQNLGTTYYRTNNQHIWRSGDDVDLMVLSNSISGTTLKGFLQTYVLQCYEWQLFTQSTYIWVMKYIYYNAVNSDLGFYYGVSTISLKAKVSFNGNGGYTNFTGSHRNISDDKKLYSKDYKGYIVRSTGKYKNLNSKYHRDSIKENIIMDDALPIVDLTSKAYDKSCWGVISSYEDTSNTVRDYDQGHFVSCMDIEGGDYRLKINGCGEGSIWVSDYNNVLENGDYITTSPIAGIGMKQDDDFLHTYTVAKITMDCDFNPQLIPVQVIKQEEYTVWNTSNIQNVYDSSNIDSNTSNITIMTSNIMTSNVLDENGYPVYEYKLDESSNIVYDYEYDMKYIKLDGEIVDKEYYLNNSNVYRLAFCGCSYKCS